jgi:hypothetical protein
MAFKGINELGSDKIRPLAWIGFVLVLLMSVLAMIFLWLTYSAAGPQELVSSALYIFHGIVIAAVALPICLRQRRNPVGWILLLGSFSVALQSMSQYYAAFSWLRYGGRLPETMLVTWLAQWFWAPPYTCFMLLLLLFPTGKLLSRRWRWVGVTAVAYTVLLMIVAAVSSPMAIELPGTNLSSPNPVGLWELPADRWGFLFGFFSLPLLLLIVVSATSIALRWRQADGVERQQIKVVVYAVIVIVIVLIGSTFVELDWYHAVVDVAFLLLPLAVALAILRYRLYDIDVVIRKTLVYSVVTGLLALVYFSSVILLQQLFTMLIGRQPTAAIVPSTLLIAALFTPLRRRVQRIIDRRFFRQRYDAQQVLASFGAAVRNETDPDRLTAVLVRVVQETMQPVHLSVWVKQKNDGRPQNIVKDLIQ